MTQNLVRSTMSVAPLSSERDARERQLLVFSSKKEKDKVQALTGSLPLSVVAIEDAIEEAVLQSTASHYPVAVDGVLNIIGSIALSEESRIIFENFDAQLRLMCNDRVNIYVADADQKDRLALDIYAWIIKCLSDCSIELLRDVRHVRSALVTIRREHEETLERFSLLESSTDYYGTPRVIERLFLRPSRSSIQLQASGQVPNILRQLIPVQTLGLSGVELYFEDDIKNCRGVFQLSLIGEGSGTVYNRWIINSENLVSGKNVFLIEKALISRDRDPVIDIVWNGTTPISLLLSSPNPIPSFCASLADDRRIDAPIAIRVLASTPGSLISSYRQGALTSASEAFEKNRSHTYALGSNELQNVAQLYPHSSNVSWNPVEFRSAHSDILVHPLNNSITIGLIKNVNVRNIKHLSALVLLEHSSANPVECSLGAIRTGSKLVKPDLLPKLWTRVEPNVLTEVRGTINLDGDDNFDIFLASRMCDDADSNLAWSFFKRIEVTV